MNKDRIIENAKKEFEYNLMLMVKEAMKKASHIDTPYEHFQSVKKFIFTVLHLLEEKLFEDEHSNTK